MHVCIIVGARPQFIKAAELIHAGAHEGIEIELVHTGQHYDAEMSAIFFEELGIPEPDVNLGAGAASQSVQTAEMMLRLEGYLLDGRFPDWIVVFGDTTSTLAASVVAAKLGIPLAHVEAGLRSFDRTMPEELNRLVCDRLSTLLFCPSEISVTNLESEGIEDGVFLTGDIMYDSIMRHRDAIDERAGTLTDRWGKAGWAVATVHRPVNVDDAGSLKKVLECLEAAEMPVVWPIHPRSRDRLDAAELELPANVHPVSPMGYLDMLAHIRASSLVMTDSGGIQKEAFWLRTPCITLRDTTEWPETVASGWNTLVATDPSAVRNTLEQSPPSDQGSPYGAGDAGRRMVSHLILYPGTR